MRRFVVATVGMLALLSASQGFCQSGAVIPQGGAGHANRASCVILKRMGPADQVTSHLYSFGIRGKQFQYVEGKLPEGFPFHGRLTDHDVRNLQGRGAEVIVVESHYTAEDLMQARADCRGETGVSPNQAEPKSVPSQAISQTSNSSSPTVVPASASLQQSNSHQELQASLEINSTPPGADIEVDGSFVGNTPSSVAVAAGEHKIRLTKNGYAPWERKVKTTAGSVRITSELQPLAQK